MFEKLAQIEKSYEDLTAQISSPEIVSDMKVYAKTMKQHSALAEVVEKYREVRKMQEDLAGAKELALAADDEMREMALAEAAEIEEKLPAAEEELKVLLLPRDPNDEKNVILEIRAGTGGDEATLFAAEVLRMYARYAERQGWKMEIMSRAYIVCSVSLRPRRRDVFTLLRSRSRFFPKPKRSTCRSTRTTFASTRSAHPGPAGNR
jgi:peptide chain release factor 1